MLSISPNLRLAGAGLRIRERRGFVLSATAALLLALGAAGPAASVPVGPAPLLGPAADAPQPSPAARPTSVIHGSADKTVAPGVAWEYVAGADYTSLGASVCTVGDLNGDGFSDAAVGAPNMRDPTTARVGAVLVFYGSAAGLPAAPSQVLYGPHYSTYFVHFGEAISPAGDVNGDGYADLLVGSPGYAGDGAAYVYLGSAGGLQEPAVWTKTFEDFTGGSALFGSTVSTAGDVDGDGYDDILIGARNAWAGGRGNVQLFRGGPAGPAASAAWSIMGNLGDNLGGSMATAGDVNADGYDDVIIGSPYATGLVPGVWTNYYGLVSVYFGGAGGLSASPGSSLYGDQAGANFGGAVSGAGDMNGDGYADVAVGSPLWNSPWVTDCGRAQAFPGAAGGLGSAAIWEEYGSTVGDSFGSRLAPGGDVNGDGLGDLLIGTPDYNSGGSGRGLVGIATGSRTNSIYMPWYWFDPGQVSFGAAVGTAGDVDGDGFSDILVGSPGYTGGVTLEGRVQLFRGAADAPAPGIGWYARSGVSGSFFGWALAPAGDVNGDGFDDVIASAPNYSLYAANDGVVVLYYGGTSAPTTYSNWYAWGAHTNSGFGTSVCGAGDLNGDGYDDIAVGSPDPSYNGTVSVWFGGPNGPQFGAANWTANGYLKSSRFGTSVAAAGDVNADGYADLVVGAPNDNGDGGGNPGPANEGKAYLYHGSSTGPGAMVWSVQGGQADGNLGNSVGGAGDVNGDGFDDLVIGQEGFDGDRRGIPIPNQGRVQIFHGDAYGMSTTPNTTLVGSSNSNFGHFVNTAGDVDGDAFSDIIVGAVYSDPNDQGSVSVYHGSDRGVVAAAYWSFTTGQAFSALGSGIAPAGDVNGDGLSDIVVGAVFHDSNGLTDNGGVWVFAGPLTGAAATTPLRQFAGSHSWENLGNCVAGLGDLNGDGFADVGAGSPGYTGDVSQEGRIVCWYGNNRYQADDTVARCAQQRRTDNSAPIGLGGLTNSGNDFRMRALPTSAAGRKDVRLEWQVAPYGVALTGTPRTSPWSDSAPGGPGTGAPLSSGSVTAPGTGPVHWRLRVASRSPYFPHSPWLSPSRNGRQEKDLRRQSYLAAVGDGATPPARSALTVSPNPFNPRTEIAFALGRADRLKIDIFDLAGRLVTRLLDEPRPAGRVVVTWDGTDAQGHAVASGLYVARASGGGASATAKLALVR